MEEESKGEEADTYEAGSISEHDVDEFELEVESVESEFEQSETAKEDAAFIEETWGKMDGEGIEEGEEEAEIEEEEEEEEEVFEEEPPDPTAPYNLNDADEAKKPPFELNAEQMAEVTQLWSIFLDYTPAYTDLDQYVTEVELVYMLKSLNLQTFTPEQLQELIDYCVRPKNELNHVNFEQFVHMVTIRQRDMPIEEQIRLALEIFDPQNTGILDRDEFRETLNNHGKPVKTTEVLIKEVDMSNDGTLGVEDIVGTICLDLNRDDIQMLYDKIYPPEVKEDKIDELTATGADIFQ